jgi:hypothetical protein
MLLFLLCAYGITFTVCSSKIFAKPREFLQRSAFLRDLLSCPFCTGFHAGWASFLLLFPVEVSFSGLGALLGHSFAAAAFSYAMDTVVAWFEPKVD